MVVGVVGVVGVVVRVVVLGVGMGAHLVATCHHEGLALPTLTAGRGGHSMHDDGWGLHSTRRRAQRHSRTRRWRVVRTQQHSRTLFVVEINEAAAAANGETAVAAERLPHSAAGHW